MKIVHYKKTIAGREFSFETGRLAHQANGAIVVRHGDTMVLCTAMMSEKGDPSADFFRLTMEYQERYYAAGKIKGSRFMKRDGRSSDEAILKARLMDRPMRPLFPKNITNEVQGIATVLSADLVNEPGVLSLTGMSMAMMAGGLPFAGPLAGVRIGMVNGELIVFPTAEETENGDMDLVVAGTEEAITMVEAGSNEVDEETYLKALSLAHDMIKELCQLQREMVAELAPEMRTYDEYESSDSAYEAVKAVVTKADLDSITGITKPEVKKALKAVEAKVALHFASQVEEGVYSKGELMDAVGTLFDENMRANILESGKRVDGRMPKEIRPVSCQVGLIPRTHGSALFQRGETQALTLTTLGAPGDAQIIDSMDIDTEKRYIHYYQFPPFSTGETKPLRGPSRREIGHGALAERALVPVIPSKEEFPYTIMMVSEIMTCNGSSSMASVCGSTMSMMDAGVPIKKPVAGIAMGLVCTDEFKKTGKGAYTILSDIQGLEDFAGDMDFKVTGTDAGITALQMDIKVAGITVEMMREAMLQAREGRLSIMKDMMVELAQPRTELSPYAPIIMKIQIDPDQIRDVIGKGGETIQKITAECGVQMDIEQTGLVIVTAPNKEAGDKAADWVKRITYVPQVGDMFMGTVKTLMDFGAFVEIVPGKDGLVHVSEMRPFRVNHPSDIVKEGEQVEVRIIKVDPSNGKISLSMKEFYKGERMGAGPAPASEPVNPKNQEPVVGQDPAGFF